MVMETSPSPQCVGREFVRQYYTLLNEAPAHLHRFYNNSSSFIHGGLDPPNRDTTPVVGQRQIHQRIQQLNFRDCHAKISQVDSQATLGNGVVVQVTGELSNGGQPMRRFTQTFVLAAQSPKKYYVHNDIFRYQDMLTDEELEAEMVRSEVEEDHETEVQQKNEIHKPEQNQGNVNYYGGVNQVVNGTSEPREAPREEIVAPATPVAVHEAPPHPQPLPSINSLDTIQQQPVIQQQTPEPTTNATTYPATEEVPSSPQEPQDQPQFAQPATAESVNEPKTYATLVKSGGGQMGGSGTMYYNNTSPPAPSQPKPSSSPPPGAKNENRTSENKLGPGGGPKPARSSEPIQRNNFPPPRSQANDDNGNYGGGADGDRRRLPSQYSDSHQLFMGNLPHTATEPELKELFGKFGTIVDLRILSKSGGKGPGPMRVPNYGFIVFEDIASVQAVLNAKPILFPDGNGTKLNVEEKKARRGGGGGEGGRGGGPRGGPMRGGMGGPPRTGRGGGVRFNTNTNRR